MKVLLSLVLFGAAVAAASASPFVPSDPKTFPERVAGRSEAEKGEFPFVVQIKRGGSYCTGSILNANWIVTAAHCSLASVAGYEVVAGAHFLYNVEGNRSEQWRSVAMIVRHSGYNPKTFANDVAVWRVSQPFDFNEYVGGVEIALPGFVIENPALALEWGRRAEDGAYVLMKEEVELVSDTDCWAIYGSSLVLPGIICIAGDSWQSGSGGLLISRDKLAGIASWGYAAVPGYPHMYSEVAHFSDWIRVNAM